MSSHSHDTHDSHPPGHKSEDQIDFTKVIAVGVVSLIVFALGTIWAVAILHHETAKVQASTGVSRYPDLGKAEIGIVDQVLFEGDHRLATWRADLLSRLPPPRHYFRCA